MAAHSVSVENKSFSTPLLVPSISSFETQLTPTAALQLQYALREPVSLVSAYDIKREGQEFETLCSEFRKSGVLLLDSGGYEHSRIEHYSKKGAPAWTFDDFRAICALGLYDFVFSFDYFWCDLQDDETASNYEARLLGEMLSSHDFIDQRKLIPVLHLHTRENGDKRLSEGQILDLVTRIAAECDSQFVAIPERELGDGLLERYRLAKAICDALAKQENKVGLHILGCGNLLSFAFFAVAGVWMADGLEWYRTFVADNFHLHHFQQEPILPSAFDRSYNPTADLILTRDFPYRLKVAAMNLVSLQTFLSELTPRLQDQTVHKLISERFGERAGAQLGKLEQ
jgi:hypothetical protein